jgi:spermidine synthase
MTGLALGAWAISRYLNKLSFKNKKPNYIRLYGILEGLIGLYGLLFPLTLKGLKFLYPIITSLGFKNNELVHFIEFGVSTLLMFPATLLMGATLPVLGSWAIKGHKSKIFSNISFLYALNTFGAVAGCLYTQFFAVKNFGISGTTLTAVVMNLLVFALCYTLNLKLDEKNQKTDKIKINKTRSLEPTRFISFLLLAIFSYSGLVSLSSEILWTRILVFPLGSSLYSFAIILATFLFGIALGSLVAEKIIGQSGWIVKFLLIELAIGVFCIGIIPVFESLPELTSQADRIFYDLANTPFKTLMIRTTFAFVLMFLPALGFGLIFPLANQINFSIFRGVTSSLGNSYAFNTMGAILGTALTPFVFIPLFGIRLSLFFLYSILIILSCWALVIYLKFNKTRAIGSIFTTVILIIVGYFISTPNISSEKIGKQNFARVEINVPDGQTKLIDYKEGNFSTLSVMEDSQSGARTLYVDGFSTATVSNSIGGSAYMQAMGFLPMLLHPSPKRSLVMCFGTGNTIGTVSLFPDNQVDGVEIDANVLSFSHWFSKWNHDVLTRDNVAITIQDARNYIEWTKKRYDVITLEPMSPVQAGVTNLYSKEFYENSLKALNDNGIMMQWLPLHLVGPSEAKSIIKTFQNVFPHTTIWNSFLTRIVLLVGSNSPVILDKNRFDEVMSYPQLRTAAEQIGIRSFIDIMDFYLTDAQKIENFVKGGEEITDNFPILEHSPVTLLPPLKKETDETFLNILLGRLNLKPPISGITNEELEFYLRDFNLRTSQRISIFSQRYNGPGKEYFIKKDFNTGIKQVKEFLVDSSEATIRLENHGWEKIK